MTDHLAGCTGYTHELLGQLSDEQLEEQIAFYREERDIRTGEHRFHGLNQLSAAVQEQAARSQ